MSRKKAKGSAQKSTTKVAPAPKAARAVTHEDIAIHAYQLWESDGRRHGQDRAHWYQAEQELRG